MKRVLRMFKRKDLQNKNVCFGVWLKENVFYPYNKTEQKAVAFFVNHVGEQYGKGSFNLHLYRKVLEAKK